MTIKSSNKCLSFQVFTIIPSGHSLADSVLMLTKKKKRFHRINLLRQTRSFKKKTLTFSVKQNTMEAQKKSEGTY